jgi:hypothetical protein
VLVTFGHNVKEIDNAIIDQLKDGIAFSIMHPLEVEVAEMLRKNISIAELAYLRAIYEYWYPKKNNFHITMLFVGMTMSGGKLLLDKVP